MRAFAMSFAVVLGLLVFSGSAQAQYGGFGGGFNNGFGGGYGGGFNNFRGGGFNNFRGGGFNNGFGGRQVFVGQQRPVFQQSNVIQFQRRGILGGRRSVLIQNQRFGGIY